MPRIPEFSLDQRTVADSPPRADVPNFAAGLPGKGLGDLGLGIAEAADKIYTLRKQQEAVDFESSRSVKAAIELAQFSDKLQLQVPQDYKGYTEGINDWISKRFEQDQKDAPSESARQAYVQKVGVGVFGPAVIKAQTLENEKRALAFKDRTDDLLNQSANDVVTRGDPDATRMHMQLFLDRVDQQSRGLISVAQAKEIRDRGMNQLSNSLFEGLYNKGTKADLQIGLNLLRETAVPQGLSSRGTQYETFSIDNAQKQGRITEEEAAKYRKEGKTSIRIPVEQGLDFAGANLSRNLLTSGLKHHERFQWTERFQNAMESTTRTDRTDFNSAVRAYEQYLMDGKASRPNDRVLFQLDNMAKSGEITQDTRLKIRDTLFSAEAAGQVLKSISALPASKIPKALTAFDATRQAILDQEIARNPDAAYSREPYFNADVRQQYRDTLEYRAGQILKARESDPVAFIYGNYPGGKNLAVQTRSSNPLRVQQALTRLQAIQKTLEIPSDKVRWISKDESKSIGATLDSGNAMLGAQTYTALQQRYGQHFPQVLSQVISDNNLPEKYRVVGWVSDQYDRQRMLEDVRNEKAIDESYKKLKDPREAIALDYAIKSEMDAVAPGLTYGSTGGGKAEALNQLYDLVTNRAKLLQTQNTSMGARDAARQAMTLITNSYNISVDGGSTNWVPKRYGSISINVQAVDAFKRTHTDPDLLIKEYGAAIPGGKGTQFESIPQDQKVLMWRNALKSARWYTNESQSGMVLMYDDPARGRIHVLDRNGNPIEVNYLTLSQSPDAHSLKEMKGDQKKPLPEVPKK